jgi:hypothetical protein
MTSIGGVLARCVAALDQAHVPFMIGGSFASTTHGSARSTQNIDIVIAPPSEDAFREFIGLFATTDYYIDVDTALRAFRLGGMFNVIDIATGWKLDFILRKDRAFSRTEFARRIATTIFGVAAYIASAEDTIIAKLEWSKLSGGSRRQRRDVAGIVAVLGPILDQLYLQHWLAELALHDEWQAAQVASDD